MHRTSLSAVLLCAGVALGSPGPVAAQDVDALHSAGKYREAAALLERSATAGDRQAQERIGLMYHYGEALYGPDFPRDSPRALYWLGQAAEQASVVARHILSARAHVPATPGNRFSASN